MVHLVQRRARRQLRRHTIVHRVGKDLTPADQRPQRHVLIVDDSVEYLSFVQVLLEAEGYRASCVSSCAAMIAHIGRETPDLVISDVRIPGEAPFAVLGALAALERTHRIPILICSGAVQDIDEHAVRLASAGVDVLLKPFDIEELLGLVRRLCARGDRASG